MSASKVSICLPLCGSKSFDVDVADNAHDDKVAKARVKKCRYPARNHWSKIIQHIFDCQQQSMHVIIIYMLQFCSAHHNSSYSFIYLINQALSFFFHQNGKYNCK
jgi:hypothetical protein